MWNVHFCFLTPPHSRKELCMKRFLTLLIAISLITAIPLPSQATSYSPYTTFHDNN